MDWMFSPKRLGAYLGALLCLLVLVGCSISYKFNGGSLDYTRIKSITIGEVHNKAPIIYPPLAASLTEKLKDFYTTRTRLEQVPRGGDLELECAITGYDLAPMAVREDNYASRTVFTVTMQVKYTNNVDEKESFDRSFKAHRDFESSTSFTSIQDQMLEEIVEELIKQVYNATVENW